MSKTKKPPRGSSPLKWHGGKSYLAEWIISHMPPHTHYCEPFFGGGQVLFSRSGQGISESVNDINGELSNFWTCLQNPGTFRHMLRRLAMTGLSQPEFEAAKAVSLATAKAQRTGWRAAEFFIRYRQSRQALGRDYVTPTTRTRRGMNEQVSAWLSAVDRLPEAHDRLIRVEIRNLDFEEFIAEYDSPGTLIYCDPPYLMETRTAKKTYGEHEMTDDDHARLLECLADICGKFILSGYPSQMYEQWRAANKFRVEMKGIDNKASSKRSKETKTECLWMNF